MFKSIRRCYSFVLFYNEVHASKLPLTYSNLFKINGKIFINSGNAFISSKLKFTSNLIDKYLANELDFRAETRSFRD